MRRFLVTVAILSLTTGLSFAQDSAKTVEILAVEQLPKGELYLPNPPALTDPLYYNDFVQYQNGKKIRDTERGKLALEDAAITTDYYMKRFGKAMGCEMTPESYPALAELISVTFREVRFALQSSKDYFHRKRPFYQFNESSGFPEQETVEDMYKSYPSGHIVRAWSIALTLVGIEPSKQDEILKTGYEIGQSRVILGYHYQSDVDAARLVASAAFARLCVEPKWQQLYKKAKAEYDKKKK